jgi:hypothetical protein
MNDAEAPSTVKQPVKGMPSEEIRESMIKGSENSSAFFQNQSSFVFDPNLLNIMNKEGIDEYQDDDDPGFDAYVMDEDNFVASCQELAKQFNFPARAINPDTEQNRVHREKKRA